MVREVEPICGSIIDCLAVISGQGHIVNPMGYISELMKVFVIMVENFKCKVEDFGFQNEKISTVYTDNGHFECDKAIITAGIWSKELMRKLGLNIPLRLREISCRIQKCLNITSQSDDDDNR